MVGVGVRCASSTGRSGAGVCSRREMGWTTAGGAFSSRSGPRGGGGAASHRPSRAGKPQRAPWRSAGETHDSPRSTIHRRTDEGSGDAVTTRFCDDGGKGGERW